MNFKYKISLFDCYLLVSPSFPIFLSLSRLSAIDLVPSLPSLKTFAQTTFYFLCLLNFSFSMDVQYTITLSKSCPLSFNIIQPLFCLHVPAFVYSIASDNES